MRNILLTVTHVSAVFLFAALSTACEMDASGTPIPAVRESIEDPAMLTIDPAESKAYADGRVIDLESGHVVLSIGHDDKLGIDSLEVTLGTMVVAGEDPLIE